MKKSLVAFFRDYVLVMVLASIIAFFAFSYTPNDRIGLLVGSAAAGLFIFLFRSCS